MVTLIEKTRKFKKWYGQPRPNYDNDYSYPKSRASSGKSLLLAKKGSKVRYIDTNDEGTVVGFRNNGSTIVVDMDNGERRLLTLRSKDPLRKQGNYELI